MREITDINSFLSLAQYHPILDVRSPGEYKHAHIPSAYNFPLFTDEERTVVGKLYKQKSREAAIKAGLDYFGVKMSKMVEAAEEIVKQHSKSPGHTNIVLVHCWRGGMRSAGVAWLLDLYGFKVYTLAGGYKAFRNLTLQQFNDYYPLRVLGGYTGSGKTEVLHALRSSGQRIIDLEGIAGHKGSAFGGIGLPYQPTQEMFENELGMALYHLYAADDKTPVWIEDESQRIGMVNIPNSFWKTMREAPVYFLDIPFEQRLLFIVAAYGKLNKEDLLNAITRIQKRLGNLHAKNAMNYLLADDHKECFSILLRYYDKYYAKGLSERLGPLLTIRAEKVEAKTNGTLLTKQTQ